MNPFFSYGTYVVKEHVGLVSSFDVMDTRGQMLGHIEEEGSALYFLMATIIPKACKPYELRLTDARGALLLILKRPFTFFFSRFSVCDASGRPLLFLVQRFSLFKSHIDIESPQGVVLGSIRGDFAAWNFIFSDARGEEICSVSKRWNGFLREAFTTSDKYVVNVSPRLAEPNMRMAVVAAAAVIDIIFKEKG